MMKNMLMACVAAGIALAGIAGCSDDAPTQVVEGTQVLNFKKGDKFTYKVYNRDTANVNITHTDSVKTETWEVIDTAVAVGTHTGAVFLVTTNGSTTMDTVYIEAQSTGPVWQYDVLGNMVKRIPLAAAFSGSVPKQWLNVGHTKGTTSAEQLVPSDAQFVMTIPGTPLGDVTATVTLASQPSHKGKLATPLTGGTFGDSSYANVFQTDHALHVTANATQPALGQVINDTLHIHYDFSIKQGLIRQTLDSKTVQVTGFGPQYVMGFERVLVSYQRK
jgi:hypothetical protein